MNTKAKLLRANRNQRLLFAKITKALKLTDEVLNYARSGRHNQSIAFCCKVYTYLAVDDVMDTAKRLMLTARKTVLVKNHFTENQLENLLGDILQERARYFRDWIRGLSYVSKEYVNKLEKDCLKTWPFYRSPYPALNDLLKEKKSLSDARATIWDYFKDDLSNRQKLNHIDVNEVFQFGRSAGWMSVAEASGFEAKNLDLHEVLETFFSPDGKFIRIEPGQSRENRKENIYNYYRCDPDSVDEIVEKCEAVLWVIAEGLDLVRRINLDYLLERLEEEVSVLVEEDEIIVAPVTLESWMNGRTQIHTNRVSLSYLRIHPDRPRIVQTSQNVEIHADDALVLFRELKKITKSGETEAIKGKRIGAFAIESFQDQGAGYFLKVGCHMIPWVHIQDFSKRFLLKAIT